MKKLISLALICSCVLTMPLAASAADAETATVDGVVYSVSSDGTYAYVSDGSAASGSVSLASEVTISGTQYPVEEVGVGAFVYSNVTSVTLPSGIETVGDRAFAWCTSLTAIDFGNAAVSIGNLAFENSPALTEVSGASSVIYVGEDAFNDTEWFYDNVNVNDRGLYLGGCLIVSDYTYSYFTLKPGTVSVSPKAFYGYDFLESIDLTGVQKIGKSAFEGCIALSNVAMPDVTYIGDSAFENCENLSGSLDIKNVSYIGSFAFKDCDAIVSADASQATFTYLSDGAFYGCDELASVDLSDNVKHIGNYAFAGATALADITCGGVDTVGYDAFRGCTALSDKAQFANVESIGTGAFDGTAIYSAVNGGLCTIGKVAYKTEQVSASSIAVDAGVKKVSSYAFYKLSDANSIAFPASLEEIEDNAFYSLTGDTNFFVFSDKDSLYTDLDKIPCGTVYLPEGKTLNNANVSVGTITGISVKTLPNKKSYGAGETLDPTGIEVVLNTVEDGEVQSFDVAQIGYACNYTYDFSQSYTVTVEYCGYTTTFETGLAGDLDGNNIVNTDDLVLLRKCVAGLVSVDSINSSAADVDGNKIINTDDIVLIRKMIAGLA